VGGTLAEEGTDSVIARSFTDVRAEEPSATYLEHSIGMAL